MTETSASFADELRSAIARRGLSLNRISRHLAARGTPVTVATLSYWQSGQRRPERGSSLRALEQLEEVLALPLGTLSSKLGPPRDRARVTDEDTHRQGFMNPSERVSEALDTLAVPLSDRMSRVSVQSHVLVDDRRLKVKETIRQVMVAERDGPDRWLVGVQDENFQATKAPTVRPEHNCRVGRIQSMPEESATLTELILDSPLRKGESVLTEFSIRYFADGGEDTMHSRRHRHAMEIVALQAQFSNVLPVSLVGVRESFDGVTLDEVDLFPVNGLVEYVVVDAGPGVYAIRWEW